MRDAQCAGFSQFLPRHRFLYAKVASTIRTLLRLYCCTLNLNPTIQEVLEPQFVLVLAWALGHVVKDVQTAEYLSGALEAGISSSMLPALISVRRASSAHNDVIHTILRPRLLRYHRCFEIERDHRALLLCGTYCWLRRDTHAEVLQETVNPTTDLPPLPLLCLRTSRSCATSYRTRVGVPSGPWALCFPLWVAWRGDWEMEMWTSFTTASPASSARPHSGTFARRYRTPLSSPL